MTSHGHKRPRVLVADDHPEMVKAICRLLALDCQVVGTVSDGADVLGAVRRLEPDVVVIDLNLPSVSGLDACREITQARPATKVIVFTAVNDPYLRQRAIEVGASAFVCKVASDDDLLSTVKSVWDPDSPLTFDL
jgi:DNA-binding NarL/FixJ family response regulator